MVQRMHGWVGIIVTAPTWTLLPDPPVLDPALTVEVDQDIGAKAARIPCTVGVMTRGGTQ
jgi:hypothetical protein